MKTATVAAFLVLLLLGTSSGLTNSVFPSTDVNINGGSHKARSDKVNLLSSPLPSASMSPLVEWNKTYGGIDDDYAQTVQQTNDGGYALAGYTYSTHNKTKDDYWLLKTDALGSLQWNMTYGGTGLDEAYSMVQTRDNGYALSGQTNSSGAGGFDIWLVKTDSQGDMQWNKTYGGSLDETATSLVQTSDGYAIAGFTESFGAGGYDFWVVKTDSFGNLQWNRTYGGTGDDLAYSIRQTTDGGFVVTGSTDSSGAGSYDVWLIKIDSNGNEKWTSSYGGLQDDYGYSVTPTNDGGYLVAGSTSSMGAGSADFFLVKVYGTGSQQWNKTYGGIGSDLALSVIQSREGGFAVAGATSSFGVGSSDFWFVKTDAHGYMQWNATFGNVNIDWARAAYQTVNGGYVIAGYTSSYGAGWNDAWLVRLASADVVPPFTVSDYDGLWHTADFTITLTATDDFSGVATTYYQVNGGSIKNVNVDGQPRITVESANDTLVHWSVDNAGHQEIPTVLTEIKLDKTPPVGSIVINDGHRFVNSSIIDLAVSATDAVSGVYQVRYSNDGLWDTDAWEAFSLTKSWALLRGDGNKTVYYQVMDNAGLASSTVSASVFLDTSLPVESLSSPVNAESFSTSTVSFNASAIDFESGISNVELYVDDQLEGNMTLSSGGAYILTISGLGNGGHTWFVRAFNGAGSAAASQKQTFTVQAGGAQDNGPDYRLLFHMTMALAAVLVLAIAYYVFRRRKRHA